MSDSFFSSIVLFVGVGYGFIGPLMFPADMLPKMADFFRKSRIPIPLAIAVVAVAVPAVVYFMARLPRTAKSRAQTIVGRAFVFYVLGLAIGQCVMVLLGWFKIINPPQAFLYYWIFIAINLSAAILGLKVLKSQS